METQNDSTRYPIPFAAHSHMKILMQMLIFVLVLFFSASFFLPGSDFRLIIAKISFLICDVIFIYCWIYNVVLKKAVLRLDEQGITLINLYTKRVNWVDLAYAQTYEVNHNIFIGLIPKNKPKQNFIVRFFQSEYALTISLALFSTVDAEKLFATISYMIQNADMGKSDQKQAENVTEKVKVRSNKYALLKVFGVFLLISLVNVFCITILNYNLITFSILGACAVILIYKNNCEEGSISFIIRILLGLFSSIPVLLIPFSSLVWACKSFIDIYGIWEIVLQCIHSMLTLPRDYAIYFIVAAVIFLFVLLSGLDLKFIKKIKRAFLKMQNGFYVEKMGRYTLIYLIDYIDFDENKQGEMVEIAANQCKIERTNEGIGAFYLPSYIFSECQINPAYFQRTHIDETDYFKLDLGGNERPVAYGYNCTLILNEEHKIEAIRLESSK